MVISCHSHIDNENASNNYFKIKDVEPKSLGPSKIENLDIKNGFKNIYLGSNFSSYNFNPNEWEFVKEHEGKIIKATGNLTGKKIVINNVPLENIKLTFYDSLLILIDVSCLEQSNDFQFIFEIFTAIYGYPTDDLIKIKTNNEWFFSTIFGSYESEFEYNIKREQTKKIETKNNSLYSQPPLSRGYSKDEISGQYYSSINYKEYFKGWEAENVRMKYYYTCQTLGYYGKDFDKINLNTSPSDTKIESSERFVIMSIKGANEILNFLTNYKTQQHDEMIKKMEERKKKEFDKL
jgi:hypothetical protein